MPRLPSFTALRAFEAAARRGGFTAAAAELHVSQSAVSQQIRALEDELGTPLFRRAGPRISLTPVGAALADDLRAGFAEINRAVEAARRRARPVVTVALLPTFAVRWLIPRLDRFAALAPDVEVRLATSVRPPLPHGGDVEIAIVQERVTDPRLRADPLMPDEMFPVCRPGLLAADADVDPAALRAATLLHVDAPPRTADWARWLDGAGVAGVDPRAGLRFENSTQAIQAALSGIGVAIAHRPFVAGDIAAGQLVQPFAHVETGGADFVLVCDRAGLDRRPVAAFRDWILAEAAAG